MLIFCQQRSLGIDLWVQLQYFVFKDNDKYVEDPILFNWYEKLAWLSQCLQGCQHFWRLGPYISIDWNYIYYHHCKKMFVLYLSAIYDKKILLTYEGNERLPRHSNFWLKGIFLCTVIHSLCTGGNYWNKWLL